MAPTTIILGRTLTRTALRRTALPLLSLGLTTTGLATAVHRQRPMQFDSVSIPAPQQTRSLSSNKPKRKDLLDAETIKQLSGGSLSGR